ncbi:MAG: energy transducer TonB [Candidatus Solibacter usitatus]|nr:energy transducer TonB [Candidatus Solibacter usitatus]
MFEQTFVDGVGKTNKTWTVLVSFIGQMVLLGIAILIPMIYFDALPRTQLTGFLVAPPPPPPPPPPPAAVPVKMVKVIPRQFDAGRLMAPKSVPKDIAMIREDELPPPSSGVVGGIAGGVAGGALGGVIGGIVGSMPSVAPPPPPPVVKQAAPTRIRVGGQVQAANLIKQPKPIYPPLAKQARISGVVRFNALIGKDGTIQNLTLVSGHPLLVPSAQEAVKQWLYKPTLLNGEPVEVATVIDVNFTLNQ